MVDGGVGGLVEGGGGKKMTTADTDGG